MRPIYFSVLLLALLAACTRPPERVSGWKKSNRTGEASIEGKPAPAEGTIGDDAETEAGGDSEGPAKDPDDNEGEEPSPVDPMLPVPTPEVISPAEQLYGEATLQPKSGSQASGTVRFIKKPEGLELVVTVSGVAPGEHGIHIHEKGDCSAGDGSSGGGHFNPAAAMHSGPSDEGRHAGDFGNITINANGTGTLSSNFRSPKGFSDWTSILGKGIILHAAADDLKTQPTGNAGARIACGVIVAKGTPAPAPTPNTPPVAAVETLGMTSLEAKSGSMAAGTVTFLKDALGIHIVANVSGVPAGDHGIHIHEKGDCSAADGTSAGGHFNPGAAMHSGPMESARHAGDFGNITITAEGKGQLDIKLASPMNFADWSSIVGKAVILHAKADDLKTQPTGDAGARIACGVIVAKAVPPPVTPGPVVPTPVVITDPPPLSTPVGQATLEAKSGSMATGTVKFVKVAGGVRIMANVLGVAEGMHGIHIHEKGDCSAADATTAGGHYNPSGAMHGAPGITARHAGDFGNIAIMADGKGTLDVKFDDPGSFSDWTMIVGKAVILHAAADDLTTQPTGNAGARIACGVIAAGP